MTDSNSMWSELDAWLGRADLSIEGIKAVCTLQHFDAGHTILSEGESSERVFFVLDGSVSIVLFSSNGHQVHLSQLEAGNWIGETDALVGGGHTAFALASDPVVVAVMTAAAFNTLMQQEPGFATAIARQLAERVSATSRRMFEFAAFSASGRIYSEVIRLSSPGTDSEERLVLPPPSVTDLATRLSIARETTSRTINRLEKMRLLVREHNRWRVLAPERLSEMIR